MNIVFIVMMAVGILAILVSFFMSGQEKETSSSIGFATGGFKEEVEEDEAVFHTEAKEETKASDAIEAAKKKAREAVNKEYQFDLHLNKDSSNQTVEELERDLLGGLDLSDSVDPVEETVQTEVSKPASGASKSSKKKNRKKNAPKNDRYDDLLFEDTSASEAETKMEEVAQTVQNATKNNTSKNNKKGKKK